jgi:hypothetical protein
MNSDKWKPSTLRAVGVLIFLALLMASLMSTCRGVGAMMQRANESHSSRNVDTSAVAGGTLSDLNNLTVNDNPAPPEKYNRVEQFGPAWKDVDHNGCDTRNDILARDLTVQEMRNACVITAGQLADPYSGKWIDFRKKDASKVQIDHVVALENAWQSGAYKLTQEDREALANDPDNLLAVNGHDNMAKGSKSADQWMPPNSAYACAYASKQVQIKSRYALTVTTAEKQALAGALATCPTN